MKPICHRRASRLLALAAAAIAARAGGADNTMQISGNWNFNGFWSFGHVPLPGENALLLPLGNTSFSSIYDYNYPSSPLNRLTIDSNDSAHYAELIQLQVGQMWATTEYFGSNGLGLYTQSAGTNRGTSLNIGFAATGNGTYTLSGSGSLMMSNEVVGFNGLGTFVQSGGNNFFSGAGLY